MLRKLVGWGALLLGVLAFVTIFVTPWPSVLVIRAIFDKGAETASTALAASAAEPSGKRPMTCLKSEGLRDSKSFGAPKSLPPIRFLPLIGRRFSTAARAARKALALASMEKSVKGSLRNSGSKL